MKNNLLFKIAITLVGLLFFVNCSNKKETINKPIFSKLNYSKTGINFSNNLTENDSLNYFTYTYLYMGGGVAVGDVNNDGLQDLYFIGNQVSNKLYLNKGNLEFNDITVQAGVSGDDRWYTGVTMADVNGDGFLDIYCAVGGKFDPKENQLFINNGDNTFSEKASEYGIDDIGNSVQSTFFDYDKDGDLDLYVANYPPTNFNTPTFSYKYLMNNVKDFESDHFYRNDAGKFTDVTKEVGVSSYGLTLSATVGDLNNDSWPDLYVSNDFSSPDYMYINNQDGTFKEVVKQATSHTAFYGMGADIADFNNDGYLDIFQVDMDAKTNKRKKANMASMNPELFWETVNAGFHFQYMHNCMQINSGVFKNGIPHFSNVSRITGTSSTDWSWGPLFADFDNDGLKDLFVSNGTRREIHNNDYFNHLAELNLTKDSLLSRSLMIPSEKIDNFMFKNKGGLSFEEVNKSWGIEYKGFSNGAVYADLDNDGDLEIITNNIDDYASVFENKSDQKTNYLSVKFEGEFQNKFGIGNRVYVKIGEQIQLQELTLTRGFQSSVAPEMHFGLANAEKIDEVKVVWFDGKVQKLNDVEANQKISLKYVDATVEIPSVDENLTLFSDEESDLFPLHKHQENTYDDFKDQVLLPHQMSTFGPALAVGDLNNDGLDDYFVGGAATFNGVLFYQTPEGFVAQDAHFLDEDKASEDVGALIFDADNDGDNDLYVVSGGYEFLPNANELQDRLYLNNGKGNFIKSSGLTIPNLKSSGSKVYNIDFNNDGKQDLIVLGRQVPGHYPVPANTYLLKNISNNGIVKFEDVTELNAKEFKNLGMATSAVITDFNNDEMMDVIIVGEWMPIKVFKNTHGQFEDVSKKMGLDSSTAGWWWSINQGDFDNDGDIDYVLGNNGLNYKYKASDEETFDIFVSDFDKDSNDDIVLSYYNDGKQYPVRGRGCSSQQIPGIKKKFKDYESFSNATLVDVYSEKALNSALHYQVKSFASIFLENNNDTFIIHKLPVEAQVSSINRILVDDYDGDGFLDALIAGNLFKSEVETPRNDASYGLFLKGDNKGGFTPKTAIESGFFTPGDVKDMASVKVKGEKYILSVKNDDEMQFIKINK